MKHLKLLLLISVFLLCSCSANEDNQTSHEVTSAPTETPIPTPQLVTYTDELFKYTFDRSLLQHQYSQDSDALQEGIAFSSIHTDIDAAITNGSCVYAGLMPLENVEQYTSLQQYPEACVTALFNGVFGIDETTATSVDVINSIYEFQATYNGYICKGKLLHCTENSCAVLVYKVSDTEDDVLVSAFDDLYNSVTVNLEFFSSSDDNITLTPASEPTVTPTPDVTATPTPEPTVTPTLTSTPTSEVTTVPKSISKNYSKLDSLQQLYASIDKDMSYTECIDFIQTTGLPYSEEKYNGSRVIQVAFTDGCTAQSYKKEAGDYLTITYRYPRDENSSNDVLEKYILEYCEYVPVDPYLTLIYVFSDSCYGYPEKGAYIKELGEKIDYDTSASRVSQFDYYFHHKH